MKYDFDEQIDRRNTNSAKFDEMDALFGSDVMHLGVADMDYRSPKPIIEAMQNIVEKGVFGYTIWPENYEELVSQWMKRRYGQETKNEWVVFSPRINMALNMAVETFTNEGDGIVLHTPAYTALQNAVEKYHRVMIESPLVLENGRYKMDFQQLRRNLDEKKAQGVCAKIMLLCNPHNPTGRVWEIEELRQVVDICKEYDLLLISDEIHEDFVKKGHKFVSCLRFQEDLQGRMIVCNSITKTFNVPGVILSNLLIPDQGIRERMKETMDRWGLHNPNIFAAGIMEAAYTQCDEWIEQVNAYLYENYEFLKKYLEKNMPELEVIPSEGTYMAWVQTEKLQISPEELEKFFIEDAKVSVYMGSRYGKHTDSFIRINIATSRSYLQEALERIRAQYYKIAPNNKK
ncbi:pyridoxal phosphate-dependent aminotransferase [Coprococcus sp. AM25-15LB]|uniref:MalY/PatB family protein n=1 Tax=Faecalimonas umbilicata TaxID=1912855 RepID=UPI000E41BE9F|nr:MalY/PatB family protein [Faecalimonas umbilicata]MDY2760966.1 MalY/PatB family protein [Faecalimonas umbilicata]RGC73585.1 pyridoxal phosphate-dependent aminotransferase [Coprococcus sp. AM25-15LB]RJW05803.1 pyridoxal phosphate-dependent aminotransferase [Coprococcus sp. AM25-4LB]